MLWIGLDVIKLVISHNFCRKNGSIPSKTLRKYGLIFDLLVSIELFTG